ncbi:MAG: transposase [Chlamydiales bacterium]|nr:transposase [Chlamydiales bacterium]
MHITGFLAEVSRNIQGFGYLLCLFSHSFEYIQDTYTFYYRTRSAIERFFGRIKENKRLALRFDKLAHTFFSFLALAVIKSLGFIC